MKRERRCHCLSLGVALFLLLVGAGAVHAQGGGVFVGGGEGDHAHQELGLVWDTAVASDRLFNYRMNLGWERFDLDNKFSEKEGFRGVLLENSFGFRLDGGEAGRLWAGPQLLFGVYQGDFGAGLGVVLGENLHLGKTLSVGLTAGIRRVSYSGLLGDSDFETVGFGRVEFLLRQARDRFNPPLSPPR